MSDKQMIKKLTGEISCEEKKSKKEFFFKRSKDCFMQNYLGPSIE